MSFWTAFEKRAADKAVATVGLIHDGHILMGKRKDNARFTTPGGHLNPGEKPVAGAVREVFEESGVRLRPSQLEFVKSKGVTKPNGEKLMIHAFKAYLPKRPVTTTLHDPDDEVHGWGWYPLHKLPKPQHVPFERNILLQGLVEGDYESRMAKAHAAGGRTSEIWHEELKRRLGQTKAAEPRPQHGTVAYAQWFIENLKAQLGQT
jgi:8-oxo-dGTP pyrophosphatase MutT (NUDIX family)